MSHRRRPLAAALALNTVALVAEVGAGIPAKSLSLVMDGVHNVSDEVALAFLLLAYTLRVGLSGRFLRTANLFNSLGLLAVSALVTWQVFERLRHPQAIFGVVPLVVGLGAAAANWGVARVLRDSAVDDAAIRLAYVHNLGDTFVSLAPVVAGALTLVSGNPFVDPIVGLVVAAAVILPTLRTLVGSHAELVWPENVVCADAPPPTELEVIGARPDARARAVLRAP
jgi:cation diffusion facilitator family transporter